MGADPLPSPNLSAFMGGQKKGFTMNQDVFDKLVERCAYVWGVGASGITADTTFAEHSTKSTQISQMTTFLEDEFDIEVPYMQFKRNKTIGEAAEFVTELLEEE